MKTEINTLTYEHRKRRVKSGWNDKDTTTEIHRVVVSPQDGLSDKPVVVATVHSGGPIHHSVADVYGRLFAAAPELLEDAPAVLAARAAIAKATEPSS